MSTEKLVNLLERQINCDAFLQGSGLEWLAGSPRLPGCRCWRPRVLQGHTRSIAAPYACRRRIFAHSVLAVGPGHAPTAITLSNALSATSQNPIATQITVATL